MTLIIRSTNEIANHHQLLDQRAKRYFDNAKADNTKKSYKADWLDFEEWCKSNNCRSLPADVQTVIRYLTDRSEHPWTRLVKKRKGRGKNMQIVDVPVTFQPLKASSIERKLSAISKAHQYAGHLFDRKNVILAEIMKGIKRERGNAQEQKTALLTQDINAMAENVSGLQGIRDKAILMAGFVGALRRSEITNLLISDLKKVDRGFELTVRYSKTDQYSEGHVKTIPYSSNPQTCPVTALESWREELKKSGILDGPLFRAIDRHGNIRKNAMCPASISLIVKRNGHLNNNPEMNPNNFGGHSLRAGFCTQAALNNVPDSMGMLQSGHKDANTYNKYVRIADRWKNCAASNLGL